MIEIKHVDRKSIIHTVDADTLVGCDLSGVNLDFANLTRLDLSSANLDGTSFKNADLTYTNLSCALLSNSDFTNATLWHTSLEDTIAERANFLMTKIHAVDFSHAYLEDSKFTKSLIETSNFYQAALAYTDFSETEILASNFQGAVLDSADLSGIICFQNVIGNNGQIKSMHCGMFNVAWIGNIVQIGCQKYTWDEWMRFDDSTIESMALHDAGEEWKKWKPILNQIITME